LHKRHRSDPVAQERAMTLTADTQVKNDQSYVLTGALAGAGDYITWTGTVTDEIAADGGEPYLDDYSAYFGTMAAVAALLGGATWSDSALAAIGAPYGAVGLGQWGGMLDTTSVDAIAYTFSSPVPAGASFTLVDAGAFYDEYSGDETYTISATLNGAALSTSGWSFQLVTPTGAAVASSISIDAATGVVTVTSYSGQTWPDSILIITPNTAVSSLSVTADTIPDDFWSLDLPHVTSALLFQEDDVATSIEGMIASWQVSKASVGGGGAIANPGINWAFMGTGDVYGTGYTDIVFRNQSDMYAYWAVAGTSIAGGGNIADPGGTWALVGLADLNGDGLTDMLFEDMTGDLWVWTMSGSAIVGGGFIGNPGAGWKFLSTGDFGGAGGGLLFENANGTYAEWQVTGTTITSSLTLGAAPAGYVYAGVADLTGDRVSDVLFRDPQTGQYYAWFMSSTGYSSSGVICSPGVNETLVDVGTFTDLSSEDLIFENTSSGLLTDYEFSNGALTAAQNIAAAGPYWSVERSPFADPVAPPPTIFFTDSSGDIAMWTDPQGVITGGGIFNNASSSWNFLAGADFYGQGEPDILLQNASGQYAIWQTNGTNVIGGGTIGGPGGAWKYEGVGDFNGDGQTDILFENASGEYAAWLMDGTQIIGGGTSLGVPGAGETLSAIGDLTGDGTSDLVFENSSGQWEVWFIANDAYAGVATIGGAGPGWSIVGIADFNGDGRQDILLQNTNGTYATWDMDGAAVIGGGQFQGPGAGWAYVGVSDLFDNRDASVIFRNTASGALLAYNMNDSTVISKISIGTPGAGYMAAATL
jgi:hypothetical protein